MNTHPSPPIAKFSAFKYMVMALTGAAFTSFTFLAAGDAVENLVSRQVSQLSQAQKSILEIGLPFFYRNQVAEVLGSPLNAEASVMDAFKGEFVSNTESTFALSQYVSTKVQQLLPKRFRDQTRPISKALIEAANRYHMDPLFLMAVILQESVFDPTAVGQHGEIGLMQIKPETARRLIGRESSLTVAETLRDPVSNIAIGSRYLAQLRARFRGNSEYYISAYNMGAASLNRSLGDGIRPRTYRDKVVSRYSRLNARFSLSVIAQRSTPKTAKSRTLVAQD